MSERSYIHQNRTGLTEGSSRLASNRPDAPATVTRPLRELNIHITANKPLLQNGHAMEASTVKDERGPVKATKIISETTTPFMLPRRISFGGGRVIGGGTSQEALRTAKRKERQKTAQKRSQAG